MAASTDSARDVIVNELLTFIQNAVDSVEEEHIRELCATMYSAEDIANAKSMLCAATGKMTDLDFIINVMKTSKDALPVFAATNLRRLPPLPADHVGSTERSQTLQNESEPYATTLPGLPPKAMAINVGELDTISVHDLYHKCPELRRIVRSSGAVKHCRFSLNSLATGCSLQSAFFRDVSPYLSSLNLSGVSDEDLKTMENLTDLDVSYSNVMMSDLLGIVKARPTLNSIAINFAFSVPPCWSRHREVLLEYQQALARFQRVQLVQPPQERFHALLALYLLQKTTLFDLKVILGYTEIKDLAKDNDDDWPAMTMPTVSHIQLYMIQKQDLRSLLQWPLFTLMDFDKYEVVVCRRQRDYNFDGGAVRVLATPLLATFIREQFGADVECLSDVRQCVKGESPFVFLFSYSLEITFLFWDRERTAFDGAFYSSLFATMQEYLTFTFDSSCLSQVPTAYKWYLVRQSAPHGHHPGPRTKLRLDYGVAFKENKAVKLNIQFNLRQEVIPEIVNNHDFLKKLTHLTLSDWGRYDSQLLKIVFEQCEALVTLQITKRIDPILLESLYKSKTLKNIMIRGPNLNNITLLSFVFAYLSECRTLENIHIHQKNSLMPLSVLPEPTALIRGCPGLYHLSVHPCREDRVHEMARRYEAARAALGAHALHLDLSSRYDYACAVHDAVFDLFKLRPVF